MATLVRWEPFRELASLQSEMSRMLSGLTEGRGERELARGPEVRGPVPLTGAGPLV